jgi:hypothetical protein
VRSKSKSARSEVAGVAISKGVISAQICAASFCDLLHSKEVEELNASTHPARLR